MKSNSYALDYSMGHQEAESILNDEKVETSGPSINLMFYYGITDKLTVLIDAPHSMRFVTEGNEQVSAEGFEDISLIFNAHYNWSPNKALLYGLQLSQSLSTKRLTDNYEDPQSGGGTLFVKLGYHQVLGAHHLGVLTQYPLLLTPKRIQLEGELPALFRGGEESQISLFYELNKTDWVFAARINHIWESSLENSQETEISRASQAISVNIYPEYQLESNLWLFFDFFYQRQIDASPGNSNTLLGGQAGLHINL